VRALAVKGQSILLRTWTLRSDKVVEPVHHQNRTKRGSRANCQRWGALFCFDHFQVFCNDYSHPWNTSLTSGDFYPGRSGGHVVPRWQSADVMVSVSLGWKSPQIMVSVSSGENHPALWLEWIFGFPVDALTLYKLTKLHSFIVFVFQFGELSPPNPFVPTGLALCETWKSVAVPRSTWLPNNCCKVFAHFGQVPDFRKNFAHFGHGWLMWLKIVMKIEKFHVST